MTTTTDAKMEEDLEGDTFYAVERKAIQVKFYFSCNYLRKESILEKK